MSTTKKSTPKVSKTTVSKPKSIKKARIQPTKIDWFEARKVYLEDSTLSYSDIAKKFKVSKTSVESRANPEGWSLLRQELGEKAFTKFTEKLLDTKSSANNRHLTHWQNLQALANNAIIDMAERRYFTNKAGQLVLDKDGNPIPTPINTFALEKLGKALKDAINGERVVLGLPTSVSAITDPQGNSVWSGFSDMVKAAEKVLSDNGQESSGGDT